MIYTKEPFKFENLKVGDICISGHEVELKVIHIEESLDFPIICVSENQCVNNYSKDGLARLGYTSLTHIKRPIKHKVGNKYKITYNDGPGYTATLCSTNVNEYMLICDYGVAFSYDKFTPTNEKSLDQCIDELFNDRIKEDCNWKFEFIG